MTYFVTVDWKRGVLGQASIMVGVEVCEEISSDALDHSIAKSIYDKLCT